MSDKVYTRAGESIAVAESHKALESLDCFIKAEDTYLNFWIERPNGYLHAYDLIVKGTDKFIYFDKQTDEAGLVDLAQPRVIFVGTFDTETGEVLDWGKNRED